MSASNRRKLSATFWSKIQELNRILGCTNGKPVLSDEDLDFIANNTAASRDQVDEQYENFLGKHPAGKITKTDFRNMMQACFPDRDLSKIESHIFRMYDKNGDGHIDFREFMIVLYIMSNGTPEENLKQIFRIFDINNDGTLEPKELDKLVKDLFQMFTKKDNPDMASHEDLANKGVVHQIVSPISNSQSTNLFFRIFIIIFSFFDVWFMSYGQSIE